MTDPLTELPNLRWLERELERKIAMATESGQPLHFLEIDFDNFKEINTRYGQKGGDEALRAVRLLDSRSEDK